MIYAYCILYENCGFLAGEDVVMCYNKLCGVGTKVWKEFAFAVLCTEHGDTGHYF